MPIDLPISDPVLEFTVLVMVALIARLTFERLHVPGLIGLLAAGMALGPGALHVLPRGDVIELLGSVGLIYIMFQAGLEIDLDIVRNRRAETITFGLLVFLSSLVPAVLVGLAFGYEWAGALMLGTLLSSHTLVAYPIVDRLGLLDRPAVTTAVGGTLITDTMALVLLVLVLQAAGGEGGLGPWWLPLALLAGLAVLSLSFLGKASHSVLQSGRLRRAEKALFVVAALLLLSSAAELIDTDKILGAFLAGVCLNRPLKQSEGLLEHVEFAGRMLFIPFFFVETGMRLELDVFGSLETWKLAAILLLLVAAGKTAGCWITGAYFDFPRGSRLLMIGLTIPQAAATLAVTVRATEAGLFDAHVVDAVIVLIFVTCLIGPVLTKLTVRRLQGS